MAIDPGSRMIAEFSGKERVNCQYVGEVEDEFVVLKVPMTPGIRGRMAVGTLLQFRYLKEGKILGFVAEILQYQASPASLIFISYPKDFSEYNLRQEGRVECLFPATLNVTGAVFQGRVLDVSPNGCRFDFDEKPMPKVNEKLKVSGYFSTMDGGKNYEFKGMVVASQSKGRAKGLGIKFSENIVLPDGIMALFDSMDDMKKAEVKSAKDGK